MKGDFTRFTHDPKKHYSRVLKQQGRVDLDADWNENQEIQQHLAETTNKDVIGLCGVPKREKSSFSLKWEDNDLKVSSGRIYVDGILCELEEGVSYYCQPDYPNPEGLKPIDGRTDLVYLDVWHRHITAVEDPDIREVALGGPDTTTRLKTVAQVKVLKKVEANNCEDEIKSGWPPVPALTKRGKLSTRAEPGMADEPCVIAPGGGYRGLENRLYRVEIHSGGKTDNPTFKWSRDNGSVVMRIEKFDAKKVFVKSKGKDQVLALRKNDWVEVLGEETELSGKPGTLARIVDGPNLEQVIDGKERMFAITLSKDVSGYKSEGNPKVRRWDHGEKNSNELADGAIPIRIGQWIELEDGVQISFQPGTYYTGDYWVFAARTATGKVEALDQAPPRGIEHHYCKLALVTWIKEDENFAADILPCIKVFPPLTELPKGAANCCTVTVGDGVASVGDYSDIQKAIDSLPPAGGRVCILPGTYNLQRPVEIKRNNLTVSGCGSQTHIIAKEGECAFIVREENGNRLLKNIRLESLMVDATTASSTIHVEKCSRFRISDCNVTNQNPDSGLDSPALKVLGNNVVIQENDLQGHPGISIQAQRVNIVRNVDLGGIWIWDGSNNVRIESNKINDLPKKQSPNVEAPGIILGGMPESNSNKNVNYGVKVVEILGNQIFQMHNSGISTKSAIDGQTLGDIEDVTIAHNRITDCALGGLNEKFDGQAVGGIVLRGVSGLRIIDNYIAENGRDGVAACGIFVYGCQGLQIVGNTITENGSHRLQCVNFTAKDPAWENINGFKENGFEFTVYGEDQENVNPSVVADPVFNLKGLDCMSKTKIEFFFRKPVKIVTLSLVSQSNEKFNSLKPKITVFDDSSSSQIDINHNYETLEATGLDIKSIEIENSALLLGICAGEPIPGYQAGIVALNVESRDRTNLELGGLAAGIHNNLVVSPQGQSLILFGWGSMSITGNTFTSQGRGNLPIAKSGKLPTFGGSSLPYGGAVSIYNVGCMIGLSDAFSEDEGPALGVSRTFMPVLGLPLHDGQVMFQGNQITLENSMAPQFMRPKKGATSFLSDMSSVIISYDDLSIQNNQFMAVASGLMTNAFGLGMTLRVKDNRFVEIPHRALSSCISYGMLGNITANNQAIHCIYPLGPNVAPRRDQMLYCPPTASEDENKSNSIKKGNLSTYELDSLLDQQLAQVADASIRLLQEIEVRQAIRAELFSKNMASLSEDLGDDHPSVIDLRKAAEKAEGLKKSINTAINRESRRPKIGPQEWMAFGTVLDPNSRPISGLRVRVYDKEGKYDDLLCETATDEYGDFYLKYCERTIMIAGEKKPDLYIKVKDQSGNQLFSSKNPVRRNPGQASYFKIRLK